MDNTVIRERRAHQRLAVEAPLTIGSNDGAQVCYLKDISRIGARVETNYALEEMSLVAVDCVLGGVGSLPETHIQCTAAVVRSERLDKNRWDLGLYFSDIPIGVQMAIDEYIAQALDQTR